MPKNSILIFTDWFAPAYKAGGPIRSCVNFSYAMSNDFNIYIITSNTDIGGKILDVKSNQWIDYDENIKVFYMTKKQTSYINLFGLIDAINPDFIYLNSMFSITYSLKPLYFFIRKKSKSKLIIAPRGMLRESAVQYKSLKKKLFFLLFRALGLANRIFFHATDDQECKDIINRLGVTENRISIISNFPEVKQFPLAKLVKSKEVVRFIYVSRIVPVKNLQHSIELLANFQRKIRVELSIFGSLEDKRYWKKCLQVIDKLPQNISVDYKGNLKHSEVSKKIENNHFFILPTFGENFGHAIFEAFAAGRPVIISDQTPWQNLENQKVGWDIALDNQQKWLEAIEYAANMEQEEFDEWCRNAWDYAHDFIHHSGLKEKYLRLFSL